MCDRFPLRRITTDKISNFLLLLSFLFIPPLSFCFRLVNPAIVTFSESATWRLASRLHSMIPPWTNGIPLRENPFISFFFKEPNSSFRPVSIEKLTSLFILFLIFLHSIPRSRANWNSNDTPLFLFRHLKTVIKTICEKIIATIIWSFHSQVSLDRNINLETENFIRKIFRMNENWIANLQRRSERLENKEESGCMQCCRKNMNIGGKFSMLDTLGPGNRDLSSFHCHFSRMLDKTMPFVSRFCPESRPRSRALEF